MEKKLSLICSLAALATAIVTLVVVLTLPRPTVQADIAPTPAPADDPAPISAPATATTTATVQESYRLEKLNQVCDLAMNRQLVPEDYLRYLDEDVAERVEAYNAALTNAKICTVRYAKEWADTFRDMSPEDDWYDEAYASYGRYVDEGDNYYRFIEEFSAALLYPNYSDFVNFGTVVGYPSGSEVGGSGGLWATGYYLGDDEKRIVGELTTAVNDLLTRCDAVRQAVEG